MKKKKVQQAILFLLFSCICFCGCDNEKEEQPEDAKMSYIQLCMPQAIQVETKAEDDPSKLGDIPVYNVWVVQFSSAKDETAGNCLKALYVPQSKISQSTSPETGLIVNLSTGSGENEDIAKFISTQSLFYVIANGGRNLLTQNIENDNIYTLTPDELQNLKESNLKEKTKQIGEENKPLIGTEPTLLTSNPFEYTPEETGIIKVRAQMFRAFAKIKITVNSVKPGLFTFDQDAGSNPIIKIHNLPQSMAMYRAGGVDGGFYPDITNGIVSGPFNLTLDQIGDSNREVNKVFYMAENLRGIGTSTTQQGKNQKENGPGTDSDKLAGCTYIVLEGTYKYDPAHAAGVKVKYTFYLGGNFTNDYNIARDYSYELTFRIAGPNSADVRVDITDGNVAVFDEVVVKPDITVEF